MKASTKKLMIYGLGGVGILAMLSPKKAAAMVAGVMGGGGKPPALAVDNWGSSYSDTLNYAAAGSGAAAVSQAVAGWFGAGLSDDAYKQAIAEEIGGDVTTADVIAYMNGEAFGNGYTQQDFMLLDQHFN